MAPAMVTLDPAIFPNRQAWDDFKVTCTTTEDYIEGIKKAWIVQGATRVEAANDLYPQDPEKYYLIKDILCEVSQH